jgi:DNA polymerase III subunit beta
LLKGVSPMDLVIAKKDLERLVDRCQGVADRKSAMPALSNILLTAEGNLLRVSATDMYLSLNGSASAEIKTAGSVALPAKELQERIKKMPEGPVQLSSTASAQTTIRAISTPRRFTLRGIPGSDFPQLPTPDREAPTLTIPAHLLAKLILRTHFSISPDETRPHVNSALFEWSNDRVRMVTTDGHRLSKMEHEIPPLGRETKVAMLIPLKAISELRKLTDDAKTAGDGDASNILISQSGPNAFFDVAGMRFSVKLIDAQFPPYQQVVPKLSADRFVRTSRKAFADALDAVRVAASDRTGGVKLSTLPDVLRITSESPESGNGFDEVTTEYKGPELNIGFNAKYFIDVLGSMDDEDIALHLTGELDPAVITPAKDDTKESYVAVVMPMKI